MDILKTIMEKTTSAQHREEAILIFLEGKFQELAEVKDALQSLADLLTKMKTFSEDDRS